MTMPSTGTGPNDLTLPEVSGAPSPRWWQLPGLMVWQWRGYRHSARKMQLKQRDPEATTGERAAFKKARAFNLFMVGVCSLYLSGLGVLAFLVVALSPVLSGRAAAWLPGLMVGLVTAGYTFLLGTWVQLSRGGKKVYTTPDRTGLMVVSIDTAEGRQGWRVESFFKQYPYETRSHPETDISTLWEHTVPELLDAADRRGITIRATAINPAMAEFYMDRVAGLKKAEDGGDVRIPLVREPQPVRHPKVPQAPSQ